MTIKIETIKLIIHFLQIIGISANIVLCSHASNIHLSLCAMFCALLQYSFVIKLHRFLFAFISFENITTQSISIIRLYQAKNALQKLLLEDDVFFTIRLNVSINKRLPRNINYHAQ